MHPIEAVNVEAFWRSVDQRGQSECWEWLGRVDRHGYGSYRRNISRQTVHWLAHRVTYELLVGPIPDGLVIDHLCRNRACVNPSHMEPVTGRVNTQRGVGVGGQRGVGGGRRRINEEGIPICRNGHAVTGANARRHSTRYPHLSICVTCAVTRAARFKDRTADVLRA